MDDAIRSVMDGSNMVGSDIRLFTPGDLIKIVKNLGYSAYRGRQLCEWLNRNTRTYEEMTNLPLSLRQSLATLYPLKALTQSACQQSPDGCRKYLLTAPDNVAFECVGIPSHKKLTACISTQAGCRMGCIFCATGASKFFRSLSFLEMYDQVFHIAASFERRVDCVVFMGQGEPFANYRETLRALKRLNVVYGIGARHLTVSTCGLVPQIRQFSREKAQYTLAISLHSAVQKTRNTLMPGIKKFSLTKLRSALLDYVETTGRRPSYEYILIDGINDTDAELDALLEFCSGTLCHVNLIQLNETHHSKLKPSSLKRAHHFVHMLSSIGVEATVRASRGHDIDAACGQLRQHKTCS